MNIFAQASKGLALSPAQRAFLKLVESFLLAGFIVAGQTLFQYLAVGNVNWQSAAHTALIAGSLAVAHAVSKYYRAHGDVLVATVADAAATSIESANPTLYNRPEQGATTTTTSNPTGDAVTVAVATDTTAAPAAA